MKRKSIHVAGLEHRNPIPIASRIGPFLMSGLISGVNPETGELGDTLAEQAGFMFAQMRRVLAAGGATVADVIKVTVWMEDRSRRGAINPAWTAMFPDPESRPVRQTMTAALDDGKFVQCDFIAVLREAP